MQLGVIFIKEMVAFLFNKKKEQELKYKKA
jgi:hypothetical protein